MKVTQSKTGRVFPGRGAVSGSRRRVLRGVAGALFVVGLVASSVEADEKLEQARGEGRAPVIDGLRDAAMHNAIREAMRNAAETVGREAVARTVVEDYGLISKWLDPGLAGYVERVEVVSEAVVGGEAHIAIDAWVNAASIRRDALAAWKAVPKPRTLVVVVMRDDEWRLANEAERAVAEYLEYKGMKVIEAWPARQSLEREEVQALGRGDARLAAMLGRGTGADVVLVATAHVGEAESFRNILYASHARLRLQAVDSDNGHVLAQVSVTERGIEGMAERAPIKALVSAAKQGVRQGFVPFLRAWSEATGGRAVARVVLSGVADEQDAERIGTSLASLEGVSAANLYRFDVTVATLKVRYEGTPQVLAERIETHEFPGVELKVDAVEGSQIRASLR